MIYKELSSWQLGANYPYVPHLSRAAETGQILDSIIGTIDATVPGCVHNDLLNAKIIPDPYFEMNSLLCSWVENYWWTYKTDFQIDKSVKGRNIRLTFCGIDYEAELSFNGKSIGKHIGMYTPFKYDITNDVSFDSANIVSVLIHNAPSEMGQIGHTSLTHTQKARFTYKWDFSTRLVQLGLYDKVLVEDFGSASIEYTNIHTYIKNNIATAQLKSELYGFNDCKAIIKYVLSFEGRKIASKLESVDIIKGSQTISNIIEFENPQIWHPNGNGEQPLYDLEVSIYDGNIISDIKHYNCGFRKIEYLRADNAPESCLPYSVKINGIQTYIKGVNMVPMDIIYGTIKNETVDRFLKLAKDAGINLIRVWGGGLIESEYFYDQCDKYGLMVWQEFIQSSSGIDNVPSKDPVFIELCKKTAIHAVKTKQHHPCLAFWCGGNELTDKDGVPSTLDDENINMLNEIVKEFDGETLFLPTSASGYHEFLDINKSGKNFDVHGPWKYLNTTEHYTLYNKSDSQLHSEFGVDGMNNYDSICTVLSNENLLVQSMDNKVWRYHGEMWDTYHRDRHIFGPIEEDRLDDFIISSQFIQAEGLKYAIEANRRRAFNNVGSIIWQFNEPWPNVSGTNLVDYYGKPKLAYYAVKAAFRKAYPSVRYDKLVFSPTEVATLSLFMTSDLELAKWDIQINITDSKSNTVFNKNYISDSVGNGKTTKVEDITIQMPDKGAYIIELTAKNGDLIIDNKYILFVEDENGFACRDDMINFAASLAYLV